MSLDREQIHQVLRQTGGDLSVTASHLDFDRDDLYGLIVDDPVLCPIWKEHLDSQRLLPSNPPSAEDTLIRPPSSLTHEEAMEKQDQYLMAKGLENCGLDQEMVEKMGNFAAFAGRSFSKMIDAGHGMLMIQTMKLQERVEAILEILDNDEEIEVQQVYKGEVIATTQPKYSEEIKLAYEQNMIKLLAQMQASIDSCVDAQTAGQKLQDLIERLNKGGGKGPETGAPNPKKRLKAEIVTDA